MNIDAKKLQAGQDDRLLFCLFKRLQENSAEKNLKIISLSLKKNQT